MPRKPETDIYAPATRLLAALRRSARFGLIIGLRVVAVGCTPNGASLPPPGGSSGTGGRSSNSGGVTGSGGALATGSGGAAVVGTGGSGGAPPGSGGDATTGAAGSGAGGKSSSGGATGGSIGSGGAGGFSSAAGTGSYDAIYSGAPWVDDQGNVVDAHSAGIINENGKYYMFGERHSDTSNAFTAFNCYSSVDLTRWKFESQALALQSSGLLGPNRVGERAKVMKCPSTGEYVMFMHTDNLTYTDQAVGYATSPTVNGPYTFKGALQYNGGSIARWDMGAFQDSDGAGYILVNGGDIYRLASDYLSASTRVATNISSGGEAPAMFRAGDTYFLLFSNKTSWERNDNYYYTAASVAGPWTSQGKFAPNGTLTWNSQTTFVLPVAGSSTTTYLFMGDRWSYPRQGSAATYVWQPLALSGTALSIATLDEAWRIDPHTGAWSVVNATGMSIDDSVTGDGTNQFNYVGAWAHTTGGGYNDTESRSAAAGDVVSIKFDGARLKLYGVASPDGGYGAVAVTDSSGTTVTSGVIDFYSKYRDATHELKYVSPLLTSGSYMATLTVAGDHSNWTDKAGTHFGSTGNYVSVDRAIVSGD